MFNTFLPFGGVGDSGYGRLHGKEGFDGCSNKKSVMRKAPLKFYPFNVIFAPYTEDKQSMIRLLATKLDYSQN
jgi:aldehyde dehydrogenase (NAD+)